MKYIFPLLLSINPILGFPQLFLDMKDGRQIQYKSLRINGSELKIVTTDSKVQTISEQDVKGRYDVKDEKYFFKLPVTPKSTNGLNEVFKTPSFFDFLERICEGNINVYTRTTMKMMSSGAGSGMTTTSDTDLFLEKGYGSITEVEFKGILPGKRKERIETLRKFVGDSPKAIHFLDNDFDLNYDDVVKLIRIYNVSMFKPSKASKEQENRIFIFSRMSVENNRQIRIAVNDSLVIDVPPAGGVFFQAFVRNQNKVCVTVDKLSTCDIIFSSPHFTKHYEVELNAEMNTINFYPSNSKKAKKYLKDAKLN